MNYKFYIMRTSHRYGQRNYFLTRLFNDYGEMITFDDFPWSLKLDDRALTFETRQAAETYVTQIIMPDSSLTGGDIISVLECEVDEAVIVPLEIFQVASPRQETGLAPTGGE